MRNEGLIAPLFFELVYRLVQLLGLFSRLFDLLAAALDILSGTLYGVASAHREGQRYARCNNFEQIQNSHGVLQRDLKSGACVTRLFLRNSRANGAYDLSFL